MKKTIIKLIGTTALGLALFSTGCSQQENREELEETYREDAEGGTADAILEASGDSNSVNKGNTGGTIIGAKDTTENDE
ncbi:MAG: hypothetical protein LPJ89_03460 [Hymenobacteraceae bacterium]|nr:hypothetical protein [Hymenobacteraceae bacterium]MDX5396218.1 hypothetical protein [Hymenobacteraceae bacterium]MDX5442821.1 hypothetical protein [Hymenobacteraceae bacterium]MDX5512281.1 hypothetical protein [Hymenobacteraceae bacterium]